MPPPMTPYISAMRWMSAALALATPILWYSTMRRRRSVSVGCDTPAGGSALRGRGRCPLSGQVSR